MPIIPMTPPGRLSPLSADDESPAGPVEEYGRERKESHPARPGREGAGRRKQPIGSRPMTWGTQAVITSEQSLGFQRFRLRERLEPTEALVQVDRTIISAGTE